MSGNRRFFMNLYTCVQNTEFYVKDQFSCGTIRKSRDQPKDANGYETSCKKREFEFLVQKTPIY